MHFPVPKALEIILSNKNIIIISSNPSSMLTAGISCIQITATKVSIAIITIKASDVSAQQIILNGFGSLWLVPAAVPASKSFSYN